MSDPGPSSQPLHPLETPFLHVFSDNAPAIALYHRMGLSIRRHIYVTVLGNQA